VNLSKVHRTRGNPENDERHTLASTFDPLDRAHGPFTLDAAATRKNAKAKFYFTKEQNGLRLHWFGNVWVNPPYSRLDLWVAKAFDEVFVLKRAEKVVMLLPANRTEQPWWQTFIEPYRDSGQGIRTVFLEGRRTFGTPSKPEGTAGTPFASVVVIFERPQEKIFTTVDSGIYKRIDKRIDKGDEKMAELKISILAGEESKKFLAALTKQIDRMEALATPPSAEVAADEDLDDTDDEEVAKAKKVTIDSVNDACKKRAAAGGKKGRAEVLAILKKKFKTESVSDLEPEDYQKCIDAMAVEA